MTDTITRDAAKALAVAYQAYHEAHSGPNGPKRDNSIRVWGRLLLEAQEETGITMHDPSLLRRTIRLHGGEV